MYGTLPLLYCDLMSERQQMQCPLGRFIYSTMPLNLSYRMLTTPSTSPRAVVILSSRSLLSKAHCKNRANSLGIQEGLSLLLALLFFVVFVLHTYNLHIVYTSLRYHYLYM